VPGKNIVENTAEETKGESIWRLERIVGKWEYQIE
jgi:hypothetical protein